MKTYTFNQAVKILNQLIPGVGDAMRDNADDKESIIKDSISGHVLFSFSWTVSPEKMKWLYVYEIICDLERNEII